MNSFTKNLGVSPKDNSIKTLKIKGEYLHIVYLRKTKSFIPLRGYRSYRNALKYGMDLMGESILTEDEFMELLEQNDDFKSYLLQNENSDV